jgi:hypothetical protein
MQRSNKANAKYPHCNMPITELCQWTCRTVSHSCELYTEHGDLTSKNSRKFSKKQKKFKRILVYKLLRNQLIFGPLLDIS